jgi:hypothetical protein
MAPHMNMAWSSEYQYSVTEKEMKYELRQPQIRYKNTIIGNPNPY